MEKGNVKLKDLVALTSPVGLVRIYQGEKCEEVFNGKRAELLHNELIEHEYEVKYFALVPEFHKKNTGISRKTLPLKVFSLNLDNGKGQQAIEGKITPDNAGEYSFSDICIKLFTDIYLF